MAAHGASWAYYSNAQHFKRGVKTELRLLINRYLKIAAKKNFIVDSKQRNDLIWTNFNLVLLQRYHEISRASKYFKNPVDVPRRRTLTFAANLIFEFAEFAKRNDVFGYSPTHRTRARAADRLSFVERGRHEIDDAFGRRVAREFAADDLKLFFNHFFTGYRQLRTQKKLLAHKHTGVKIQRSRSSEGSGHWSGSKSFSSTGRRVS